MSGEALLFVLVFLVGAGASFLLFSFVRGERDWEPMDRKTAEATARRDGDDDGDATRRR